MLIPTRRSKKLIIKTKSLLDIHCKESSPRSLETQVRICR